MHHKKSQQYWMSVCENTVLLGNVLENLLCQIVGEAKGEGSEGAAV